MYDNILKELHDLSIRFKPILQQLDAKLLTMTYMWDGRKITYSFDDEEFPVDHITYNPAKKQDTWDPSVPPPVPTGLVPMPKALDEVPTASSTSHPGVPPPPPWQVDLPGVPLAPPLTPPLPAGYKSATPARNQPSNSVSPLTDNDPCPFGKEWKGILLKDVKASFLLWAYEQDWAKSKHPRLCAYVDNHRDVLEDEAANEKRY